MRYRIFAVLMSMEVLVLALLVSSGCFFTDRTGPDRRCNRQLVKVFELTDMAIWTGARYTRHLSQADTFSAFQDSMGALEHFPEGALAPLPLLNRPSETGASTESIAAATARGQIKNESPS
jgi:hypothetical protein